MLAIGLGLWQSSIYNRVGPVSWTPPTPDFEFDFVSGSVLPSEATFTGSGSGRTYYDVAGVLQTAALDTPRFDHDQITHERLGLRVLGGTDFMSFQGAGFSSWYNESEGTFVFEWMRVSDPVADPYPIGFSDGPLNVFFGTRTSPGIDRLVVNCSNGGSVGDFRLVTHKRLTFAYALNDRAVLHNERQIATSGAAFTPPANDRVFLASLTNQHGSFGADIHARRFKYFRTRIDDADLPYLTTPDVMLVGHGDSIIKGDGVSSTVLYQLSELIRSGQKSGAVGAKVATHNFGVNGISYGYAWPDSGYAYTMFEDYPLRVAVTRQRTATARRILIIIAGTNGLYIPPHTAVEEYADFVSYITRVLAAGWSPSDVLVYTVTPRENLTDSIRTAFNALVVTGASTYGYKLARMDLDPDMGGAGQWADTNFFSDGLHWTSAGHAKAAALAYDELY